MKSHLLKALRCTRVGFYDLDLPFGEEGRVEFGLCSSSFPAPQHTLICEACLIFSQVCWNFIQSRKKGNSFPFLGGFVFIQTLSHENGAKWQAHTSEGRCTGMSEWQEEARPPAPSTPRHLNLGPTVSDIIRVSEEDRIVSVLRDLF